MPAILTNRALAWLGGEHHEASQPRLASTVMLVRDGTTGESVPGDAARHRAALGEAATAPAATASSRGPGVEVFMLHRVASMKFAPRVWVFPGGGVDPRDADAELPWAGPTPQQWSDALGTADEAAARELVVAAVRELFEECGVLLAGADENSVVADLAADPAWGQERAALLRRDQSFAQMLIRRGLVLRSDLLSVRGHWITPQFEPRRYDTRFFAARVPEGQVPDDLTTEADHADWSEPGALLSNYAEGRALLLPPTVVCVEQIAAASDATDFLAQPVDVTPVMPWPVETDGGVAMRCEVPE